MERVVFGVSGHPVVAVLDVGDALDTTVGADVCSLCDDELAAALERCGVWRPG